MKTILIILAIIMLAAGPVSAQIPRLINYQGVLTDDMGVVVSDGSYSMTFRIYDVPSGGTQLWEETIDVNVSKGIFNTTLGHDVIIAEVFDKPLYLTIEIDGGGELSPRRIFTANAYAFSTRAVYGVSNVFPAEGNVGIGITNPAPEAPLHIYTNISSSSEPTLLFDNVGNQTLIDFRFGGVTQGRIRNAAGGDFYFGTLTNTGLSLRTNDLTRLRILPDGSTGIGSVTPLERLDVNGAIRLGTTANSNAGTLRWTGSDFEGYDGSLWQSLTSDGGSTLPSGSSTNTLRHNGANWVAATNLSNDGTNIGINTASPSVPLHIVQPSGQVALRVDGYNASYASIYVNAATAPADPVYGYLRGNTIYGYHYIESDYSWNLNLNSSLALHVEPNGWTTFGGVGLAESMNLPGAIRIGNTTGNNAGSIKWTGADFEGYDGASWHSLTAGGLPAGTTGQTLHYDGGWIADGSLYNNGTDVGIGTTSPDDNLHIYEDVDAWIGIRIENPNAGSGSGEQISFVDENGTLAGIRLYDNLFAGAYSGAMAIYNNRPSGSLLFRTGGMNQMRITDSGELVTYGPTGNRSLIAWNSAVGGNFTAYDETGSNMTVSLEGDGSGEGGFIWVRRNNGSTGFTVDGNHNGTQDTKVGIYGALRSAEFNMNESGDASIDLPTSAISASEMLDEPGAASSTANTSTVIGLTPAILLSRTITVPDDGYVLVLGSTQGQIGHTIGTSSTLNVGVSDDPSALPDNQDLGWLIPTSSATGTYTLPITAHGLFEVSAGSNTFYLLGRSATASAPMFALDKQLSLIYIPTSYGTVTPTLASSALADSDVPTDEGLSAGDISSERVASIEANNTRIEHELAEMRAKIEALQTELENANR